MPNIVEFLTARLDETQVDAEAAHAGPWVADLDDEVDENVTDASGQIVAWVRARPATAATRAHIARHDPARVLREVKAKRAIMEAHACVWLVNQWVEFAPGQRRRGELRVCRACEPVSGFMTDQWPCLTLKLLAAPYVDHPDYKQEWQVG